MYNCDIGHSDLFTSYESRAERIRADGATCYLVVTLLGLGGTSNQDFYSK